jgi:peptide/nickel transport system substrate-binding protein
MTGVVRGLAVGGGLLIALLAAETAFAQKSGGILKISFFDNPASMSLHEEATGAALRPMMGVFNNLVMYRQDVPQNSLKSIVPDLATGWSWNEEGTELTFPLARRPTVHRQGRQMHLGPAHRQIEREAACQPAQILVPEP